MPKLGYLDIGTPLGAADDVAALREGLGQAGYIEGRNLAIEFRFAHQTGIALLSHAIATKYWDWPHVTRFRRYILIASSRIAVD